MQASQLSVASIGYTGSEGSRAKGPCDHIGYEDDCSGQRRQMNQASIRQYRGLSTTARLLVLTDIGLIPNQFPVTAEARSST